MERDSIPFGGGGQRVRDNVLVILSEEFPLTAKELFGRISKLGQSVTYQAVHKVAVQLVSEGILEKKEKGFQLSRNWVHRVKDYAFTVDTVYTKGKQYKLPSTFEKPHTICIDDFSSYVVWIAECFRDGKFTHGKKIPLYAMFNHAVWPLRFNFMDFELLRQMTANCETRGVCAKDMPFDRWIATHYKLGGVKEFETGIPFKIEEDYFVCGDVVIRVKFSPETLNFLDKIYSKIHDLKDLFQYYFKGLDKKDPSTIMVTIEYNPMFARMIQNQIKQYLSKKTAERE